MTEPFLYPAQQHVRTSSPGPFSNVQHYKPFLASEFGGQCVYCRYPDALEAGGFEIDHYRPQSNPRFAGLILDYRNLYYACRKCNRSKGRYWSHDDASEYVPNPCEYVMAEHLQYSESGPMVEALSTAGRFTVDLLNLNDDISLRRRQVVLELVQALRELRKRIVADLATLSGNELAEANRDIEQIDFNLHRLKAQPNQRG